MIKRRESKMTAIRKSKMPGGLNNRASKSNFDDISFLKGVK